MSIYIDHSVVTKQALFETLGISNKLIPAPREKRFQFPVRVDQDGNKRHLKTLLCNEYSVYIPSLNRDVRVRWANSQRKDKEGNYEYFPTNNTLEAGEGGVALVSDDMVYLWWFINPMNRQSPFRKPQAPVFYEFLDNDQIARVSNDKDASRITAMSIVLGSNAWTIEKLRTLAKGMGIAAVNEMTDDVVKSTLKDKAFNDPVKFINMAESREVAFTGKIQEAIDRNILQLKTVNGMQRWYLGQSEILPVQYGIEARKVLEDHLSAKWYMYADDLNALLTNTTVRSNLFNPVNDTSFEPANLIDVVAMTDDEVLKKFKELKKDYGRLQRIKKYSETDVNTPGLHANIIKAMHDLAPEIELYRKAVEMGLLV